MATIYVSNSTLNSLGLGDDARNRATAASKSTPVLSIIRALAVAVDGDTIIVNDGTYSANTYLNIIVPNLTLLPLNDYQVTVQDDGSTQTVRNILVRPTGTGFVCGKIIFDAQNTHTSNLYCNVGGGAIVATFHGTHFINATTQPIVSQYVTNLTFDQGWLIDANHALLGQPIYLETQAGGEVWSFTDGTLNAVTSAAFLQCVRVVPIAAHAPASLAFQRNTVNYSSSNATTQMMGIDATGVPSYDIQDNLLTARNVLVGQSVYGIQVPSSTGFTTTHCALQRNTVVNGTPSLVAPGIGISVGDDSDVLPAAGANTISGVLVEQNLVQHANHGILIGWLTATETRRNTTDNTVIGVIGKHTTSCDFEANLIKRLSTSSGGALRSKAGTNDRFFNNLHVIDAAYPGISMYATDGSTGIQYANNILYARGAAGQMVSVLAGADATFRSNDYWSDVPLPSNAWSYQGTTYATFALWKAAHALTDLNTNPQFQNAAAEVWSLLPTSPLVGAGVSIDPTSVDFQGRTFATPPSIGLYEAGSGVPTVTGTWTRNTVDFGDKRYAGAVLLTDIHGNPLSSLGPTSLSSAQLPATLSPGGGLQAALYDAFGHPLLFDTTYGLGVDVKRIAALAAGEAHIGAVGANSVKVSATPTLSAPGAYASGDYVGTTATPITFAAMGRVVGGHGVIEKVTIIDKAAQALSLSLWLFDTTFTPPTDNAAWSISDADAALCIGVIPITSWEASALNAVGTAMVSFAYKCAAGDTALYGALVARSAPTYASGDLIVTLVASQD